MQKVIIVHGFCGTPNGNWKPWLLAELEKEDIYASSISLPNPDDPSPNEWISEISHQINMDKNYDVYLVGHSLGATAILRYLESAGSDSIAGCVLISGPCEKNNNRDIDNFLENSFDFKTIKPNSKNFLIIHSDNDPYVPFKNAEILSKELNCELITVHNGGHFNSQSGYFTFPECLNGLKKMLNLN